MSFPENLLVGTSSWSSSDWLGPFYPPDLKPGQFIVAYAQRFRAVEIDSTYYSIPAPTSSLGGATRRRRGLFSPQKFPAASGMKRCSGFAPGSVKLFEDLRERI